MVKNYNFLQYLWGPLLSVVAPLLVGCPALNGSEDLPFVPVTGISGAPKTAAAGVSVSAACALGHREEMHDHPSLRINYLGFRVVRDQ
jgi:hypothetical protein